MTPSNLHFYDFHPPLADFKQEVLQGLGRRVKAISPKFFYDRRGSQLFDAITELSEYYPTRTEIQILREHGEEIARQLGEHTLLLELGSGSSLKIRVLLSALQPSVYMPLDISRDHLLESASALAEDYPHIEIHAACADYSSELKLPEFPEDMPKVAFFPGSSIGNFDPLHAQQLLQRVGETLTPGGRLLIGVDLKKDPEILEAAYNDAEGVTAEFNLNLLERINRELDADFELENFRHEARYNQREGRVEMHLVSQCPQKVAVEGELFEFGQDESIHTESSYKYTVEEFHRLAAGANFESEQVWTDPGRLFSMHCLRVI